MSTIKELESQIQELQRQVIELKAAGKQQAIEEIKAKMDEFGITTVDLEQKGKTVAAKEKKEPVIKYRKDDKTWSGGKGPKHKWVKELIADGGNIEDYLVSA